MALPASGEIHLDEIHVEAGGTTGTEATINDADIVALISGTQPHSFSEWWGASASTVTVSGEAVSSDTLGSASEAGIRFNSDGTVDRYTTLLGYVQIDSGTDWIIPNGDADSTYDVRITNVSWTEGAAFYQEAAAEDAWISLSADRYWSVRDIVSSSETWKDVSFTVEIRKDAGAVIDSATYSLYAQYDGI